jgi:hypothetical protein
VEENSSLGESEIEPRAARPSASLIGAVVALVLGSTVVGLTSPIGPFGFDSSALFGAWGILVLGVACAVGLGWRLGGRAAAGSWWATIGRGILFGASWPTLFVVVTYGAAIADAELRGVGKSAFDLGSTLSLLIYSVLVFSSYLAVVVIPAGLIWAVGTRLTARAIDRVRGSGSVGRGQATSAKLLVALLVISVTAGATQAISYTAWGSRCLSLPAGTPIDAAFSPAGDMLAVALRGDQNVPGSVLLMHWPSGQPVASWSTSVDPAVAVDPAGRVYWSSTEDGSATGGVMTAVPGSSPTWFTSDGGINNLTWTTTGLRGTTSDGGLVASVSLQGVDPARVIDRDFNTTSAYWVSSDGSVTATVANWPITSVEIRTAAGSRSVALPAGARSIALSSNGHTVAVAAWSDGTWLVDVATAGARQVLRGSQAFVALSDQGDVAWANDEAFGYGRLCTSTLAQLGG